MMCELCDLVKRIDLGTEEPLYKDEVFVVVFCSSHPDTPMGVLRRHSVVLVGSEMENIAKVMSQRYPKRRPRGTGMPSIRGHWHEHWV